MAKTRCQDPECTNEKAWGFRRTKHTNQWLCDDCWGRRYGDETCSRCEQGCYTEDYDETTEKFICQPCLRAMSDLEIDRAIDVDIAFAVHGD